jgi:hypothetical protein
MLRARSSLACAALAAAVVLALSTLPVWAQVDGESTAPGASCPPGATAGQADKADWDTFFECNASTSKWQRGPYFFGATADTCDSNHAGMVQWTGGSVSPNNTFEFCNGSTWTTVNGSASSVALSGVTAATTTSSINSGANAITWAWNSLTSQTGLTLSSSSMAGGSILSLQDTAVAATSTGAVLVISDTTTGAGFGVYSVMTGQGNTGYAGYFTDSSTSSGWALGATGTSYFNGHVGIGTAAPTDFLDVAGAIGITTTTATAPVVGIYSPSANTLNLKVGSFGNIAIGSSASASGGGTAVGPGTSATGLYSIALGGYANASTTFSVAIGNTSNASGVEAYAIGGHSTASGTDSIAIGQLSQATNYSSIALGQGTFSSGIYSTAMGFTTTAASYDETVIGQYNALGASTSANGWVSTDPLFEIGNGSSTSATSDAMVVLKNGNVGIGTTTPGDPLTVASKVDGAESVSLSGDDIAIGYDSGLASHSYLRFTYPGGTPAWKLYTNNGGGLEADGSWGGFEFGFGSVEIYSEGTTSNPSLSFSTGGPGSTGDVNISRSGASTLAVGNGTAGDTSGTLIARTVGIGTPSPAVPLEVSNAGDPVLRLTNTTTGGYSELQFNNTSSTPAQGDIWLNGSSQGGYGGANSLNIWTGNAGGPIAFFTNAASTPEMVLTSTGSVGIGTTGPGTALTLGSGQISVPDTAGAAGNLSAPPYSVTGALNTGMYKQYAQNNIILTANGQDEFRVQNAGGHGVAVISTGTYLWNSQTSLGGSGGSVDTGISRGAAAKVYIGNGTQGDYSGTLVATNVGVGTTGPTAPLDVAGAIRSEADSYVSSDFSKTSSTSLAAITGLTSGTLAAGKAYAFDIWLYTTSNSSGGIKVDLNGGSATATTLIGDSLEWDGTSLGTRTAFSSLSTALCSIAAVSTATCHITGTIIVNAGGTFIPRFAQNTSNGTASKVKTGSSMTIRQLN